MSSFWDWHFVGQILPDLLRGLLVTVQITVLASSLALSLGLLLALLRYSQHPLVAPVCTGVIEFIRGTPLLVQAYVAFYVLPLYGLQWSAFVTGVVILGVNYSAYTAEVYRAGIQSVPRGQWEATLALSLPQWRRWQAIILPQAIRVALPTLGNYVIAMFKESALLSAITVTEVLSQAMTIGSQYFRYLEPLTVTGILYLLISFPAALLINGLERAHANARGNAT